MRGIWNEEKKTFEMVQPTKQPWWPARFADLVDRRRSDGTYEPREKQMISIEPPRIAPQMLPRLGDMTRQTQRRLFREACKLAGVDYRDAKKA
jgi:hypothetical protein